MPQGKPIPTENYAIMAISISYCGADMTFQQKSSNHGADLQWLPSTHAKRNKCSIHVDSNLYTVGL